MSVNQPDQSVGIEVGELHKEASAGLKWTVWGHDAECDTAFVAPESRDPLISADLVFSLATQAPVP